MRKIETYVKACCISKRVGNCKQPALHHDLLREVKACAEDDEDMDILYRWLCCGCPLECTKPGLGLAGQLDKSNVLQRWKSRQETVGSLDMQVDIASAVLQALNVFSDLVIAMVSMVKNSVACCDTSSGSLTLLRKAWFTSPDDSTDVDYEFTWFNAWLFCGSENLWAWLVLKLHEAVEAHYGPSYSRAAFNALMFSLLFFLIGFIITRTSDVGDMVIEMEHVTEDYKQFIAAIGKKLAGISMAGVSGSVMVQQVLTLFKSPVTLLRVSRRGPASPSSGNVWITWTRSSQR